MIPPSSPSNNPADRRSLGIALLLIFATLLAFSPVFQADFVNYDDLDYVVNNPQVKAGWTWAGFKWAFTTDLMGSWHPVTWLSHMTDVQLFGLNAGQHHATNLMLHLANTLLLWALFHRLTGARGPSAVAAGLFALHPLHVESVAWVAERKDVLSAFFGLLGLLAYTCHAQQSILRPPSSNHAFLRSGTYWLTFVLLACGLMSKPMLVTWPLLMLLLDWWPLNRLKPSTFNLQPSTLKWLLVEKLPFFGLVAGVAVITIFTQHRSEAVMSFEAFPLPSRLANVLHSLFIYLVQFVWPTKLAAFYPFEPHLGVGRLLLAGVVVAGLSYLAWRNRTAQPFIGFGWLWYLVVLFPVCGLVQAGLQAHADRYMYLPSIGLGVAVVWGLAEWSRLKPERQSGVVGAAVVGLALLGWRTNQQAQVWKDSPTLFRHALAVTEKNFMAHQGLGEELLKAGQLAEAKVQFETALRLYSDLPSARNNLGVLLNGEGRFAEALVEFKRVLTDSPKFYTAHFNQAEAYEGLGRYHEAVQEYRTFLAAQPKDLEARLRLARCLNLLGQVNEALAEVQALQPMFPTDPRICAAVAAQLQAAGRVADAVATYERGLTQAPNSPELHNNLAWLLATYADADVRNGDRAVTLAERACQLTGNRQPFLLGTLAAAYAEAGRFPDAVATAQRAIDLATAAGQPDIAARNRELLELYRAGQPYHEPAPR